MFKSVRKRVNKIVIVVVVCRYIYWSQWGDEPVIKRAEMDGSNVFQITEKRRPAGRANSLTIDYEKQRLYWVDFESNIIMSSDTSGEIT